MFGLLPHMIKTIKAPSEGLDRLDQVGGSQRFTVVVFFPPKPIPLPVVNETVTSHVKILRPSSRARAAASQIGRPSSAGTSLAC